MSDPHRENKRLYALDEAAVGKEKAIKRWQIQVGNHWENLNHRPTWFAIFSYRRDPEAPPLPSLDWHEAPDWAEYRVVDQKGSSGWVSASYPSRLWTFIEPRPNPKWFELTRADYEASKEDNNVNAYLTGPALHRAIADAMENGERPEVFEYKGSERYVMYWSDLVAMDKEGYKIRRKPRMRHLTTQDGQRWEWPEPIREIYPNATFWLVFETPKEFGPRYFNQLPTNIELDWVRQGRCFTFKADRDQAERALIAASGGSCE